MKVLKGFFWVLLTCIGISMLLAETNAKNNIIKVSEYVQEYTIPAYRGYNYVHILNDEERVVYEQALENLKIGKLTTKNFGLSSDSVYRVASSVLADHPEFFWLKPTYNTNWRSFSFNTYNFWDYTTEPEKYTWNFSGSVNSYVAETLSYRTNDARIRYVHDKLVRSVQYNHTAANETLLLPIQYQYAGTAYGTLVNSSAVCAGYAKAFQIVLNRCGYECGYVTGDTAQGLHAWNEMYLDGIKYCFDVTWDDMGDYYTYPNDLVHTYYAISPSQMANDHVAEAMYQN